MTSDMQAQRLRERLEQIKRQATSLKLRPCQSDCVTAVTQSWTKFDSVLAALATGTGKTVIALSCLAAEKEMGYFNRALFLVGRRVLTRQTVDTMRRWFPQLSPGVVMAEEDDVSAEVVIATVQSLNSNGRLQRVLDAGHITHVITDEAHHAVADTYRAVYDAVPGVKHLGITATPRRTDEVGLKAVFEHVAYRLPIKEAIELGALTPFVAKGVTLPVDGRDIQQVGDGYDDEEMGRVMTAANAMELVIHTWEKETPGRPTIAFTPSVAMSHALASAFRREGHSFHAIDYKTPEQTRRKMITDFKKGQITGLCSVFVLAEGFDAPNAEVCLSLAPTNSALVYVQRAGRVLRLHPGKELAYILDFAPRDLSGGFLLAGDLIEGRPPREQRALEKAEDDVLVLDMFALTPKGLDADPDELVVRVLDLLRAHKLAFFTDGLIHSVSVNADTTVIIVSPDDEVSNDPLVTRALRKAREQAKNTMPDLWPVKWQNRYRDLLIRDRDHFKVVAVRSEKKNGRTTRKWVVPLGHAEEWDDAQAIAEDWSEDYLDPLLAVKAKRWRKSAPTDGQIKWLKRFQAYRPGMTRGLASRVLSHQFALSTLKSKGWRF